MFGAFRGMLACRFEEGLNSRILQCEAFMSSNNTLDPELLAELVSDIDCLGLEILYLRAAKPAILEAVRVRNVSLDAICASVNQRLKVLRLTVEPRHVQAILDELEKAAKAPDTVFAASFQGRAPPRSVLP
ncbi:hypothetical protein [Stenotrophomonas sp. TWI1183]|uniref:hypothetical protein n=1 Tax=Stenotrophomonas sp. TWI1183 TaxID=3136799 RepID=UPI0032093A75